MTLAFHAAPPMGEWLNDPNGIVHAGGQWRLFAQHRVDAPDFRATGWARLSSPDLLHWAWDGPVLRPDADWHYSGSIGARPGGLRAWHSVHRDGRERQVLRDGDATGAHWSAPVALPTLGAPVPDRRDPFVWQADNGWRLLLAEPCGWHAPTTRSRLTLHGSGDGSGWRPLAALGPWQPAGVMWEVPVLLRVDGQDVLLVSTVDRRRGGADCSVRGWVGRLDDAGFHRHPAMPAAGQRLDLGPDFYAAIPALGGDFVMAWASSWATARAMPWPGFAGGPLSLPRRLGLHWRDGRPWLVQRVAIAERFTVPAGGPSGVATALADAGEALAITVDGIAQRLRMRVRPARGEVRVRRDGIPALAWARTHRRPLFATGMRRVAVFVDGPVIEVALPDDGLVATVALAPAATGVTVTAGGGPLPLDWRRPRQP